MFGCFFGHKFGKLTEDGYQYCGRCGIAVKPNPCTSGHIWQTKSITPYKGQHPDANLGSERTWVERKWKDNKLSQVCERCGEHQTIWEFGH
jgi:ribosomal protein S27AE